ncbi:MAG: YbaN family protein [Coriobacteriales bacterium]|nr:YbaN family protein [Coriobacteriales bacterium]
MKRLIFFICAWLCTLTAVVGIFVPVLPTTPLLLLATFLFANSSPRYHAWIQGTQVYKRYVLPFRERGGLPVGQKVRIVLISFLVLGISALSVRVVYVWIILVLVAIWLLYLMLIHIPTVPKEGLGGQAD